MTKALRKRCKLREAKPLNKMLDRCKALATILLTCAVYERSDEIVMPRSKTHALFVSKTPFR